MANGVPEEEEEDKEVMGDDSSSAITSSIGVSVVLAIASIVGFAFN